MRAMSTTPGRILSDIAFVDTETIETNPRVRHVWNLAIIRRTPDGRQHAHEWIVDDVDLTDAHLRALAIGHFWERHPRVGGDPGNAELIDRQSLADLLMSRWLRPALTLNDDGSVHVGEIHIVGAVPSFDQHALWMLMQMAGLPWLGHYHLADTENVLLGYLLGRGGQDPAELLPPWKHVDLIARMGLPPAPPELVHTALGDAVQVMRAWDRMYGRVTPESTPMPEHGVRGPLELAELRQRRQSELAPAGAPA